MNIKSYYCITPGGKVVKLNDYPNYIKTNYDFIILESLSYTSPSETPDCSYMLMSGSDPYFKYSMELNEWKLVTGPKKLKYKDYIINLKDPFGNKRPFKAVNGKETLIDGLKLLKELCDFKSWEHYDLDQLYKQKDCEIEELIKERNEIFNKMKEIAESE